MASVKSRSNSIACLAGVAVGFLLAVAAGYRSAHYVEPAHFKRFHQRLSGASLFFPTFSMMENLALANWSPGRTVVIIGGNSVLKGVGQPQGEIWSDYLQELLGDHYIVVNLALDGGNPFEGAALVAESLIKRGVPVIYLTDSFPMIGDRAYTGLNSYLYWDALYKQRLLPFPKRDEAYLDWRASQPARSLVRKNEYKMMERLDAALRFQSLWQHVAYQHFFTVWSYLEPKYWWKPRKDKVFSDPELGSLLKDRFPKANFDQAMTMARNVTSKWADPDAHNGWTAHAGVTRALQEDVFASVHPALRPHMILLLTKMCPYYLNCLEPAEYERDRFVYDLFQKTYTQRGISCTIVGRDFFAEDYVDLFHLAPSGGRKLAIFVAREIHKHEAVK